MPPRPRFEIADLELPWPDPPPPQEPPGQDPEPVLDFASLLGPLGPSPRVAAAVAAVDPSRPPDPEAQALRDALSAQLGVPAEHLLAGNGVAELALLAALALLRPGDRTLVLGPTSPQYGWAGQLAEAKVLSFQARKKDHFTLHLPALQPVLQRDTPRMVFLCNPNNPTSLYLHRQQVLDLAAASGCLLVVDETHLPFVRRADSLLELGSSGQLLLLRSLAEPYALAGLRLAYAVGGKETIDAMREVQPPGSVSGLAQAAGLASLDDVQHLEQALAATEAARVYLQDELTSLGLQPLPSSTNFVLARPPDAAGLTRDLRRRGIAVYHCASFGLDEHIRLSLRPVPDCQRLVAAIHEVLQR